MRVVPQGSTAQVDPAIAKAQATRDSVVAKIEAIRTGNPNPNIVKNATNVQPEELSAIRQPRQVAPKIAQVAETTEETSGTEQLEALSQDETVEQPTEEAPKAPDALSTQHALFARKERALRAKAQQQEQAFKQREDSLRQREIELAAKGGAKEDLSQYVSKTSLKSNPLKFLNEAGVSYDEIVQQVIQNQTPMDPRTESIISQLTDKIAKLEAASESSQKQFTDREQQSYQAAIKQISADAKKLVYTDPSFELVKATNSVSDVVELIETHWKETQEVMSVEEAAQQVEDYLADEAMKLARLSKIQKRLQPTSARPAQTNAQTPQGPKQPQTMKTLTNSASSSRPMTARDRAIAAAEGRLK